MTEKKCPQCQEIKDIECFGMRPRRFASGNFNITVHSWCIQCRRKHSRERKAHKISTPEGANANRASVNKYREKIGLEGRRAMRNRERVVFEGEVMTRGEMRDIKKKRSELKASEAQRRKNEIAAAREMRLKKKLEQNPWSDPSLTKAEQYRIRYRLDPEFNIKERLRACMRRKRQGYKMGDLIRAAIKRDGLSPKFELFAGYSIKELRIHLERQFTKGMTWDNFNAGEIHIDHIRPLSSFDLADEEQLRLAWDITNLRPLWAEENIKKSSKRQFLI